MEPKKGFLYKFCRAGQVETLFCHCFKDLTFLPKVLPDKIFKGAPRTVLECYLHSAVSLVLAWWDSPSFKSLA